MIELIAYPDEKARLEGLGRGAVAVEVAAVSGATNRLNIAARCASTPAISDRAAPVANLEDRMDDGRAVMDAARCQRAALFGVSV
jgi:hypothetical protein